MTCKRYITKFIIYNYKLWNIMHIKIKLHRARDALSYIHFSEVSIY